MDSSLGQNSFQKGVPRSAFKSADAFPPQGPFDQVPLLLRYYSPAPTSRDPSRAAPLPSPRRTSIRVSCFAPLSHGRHDCRPGA
jgi:hypothetical protein